MNGQFKMVQKKEEWIKKLKEFNFNTYQEVNKIISTKNR